MIAPDDAARFARMTLGHVGREYPHALVHVLEGPEDVRPAKLHPIFHGSFDWHSCIHAWWQLLRLARLFPDLAPGIRMRADAIFTRDNAQGERVYLERHPTFERPYGWAWLLALHEEAGLHEAPWAEVLEPLARLVAARFGAYLRRLTYPIRTGVHSNTAFALVLAHGWARAHDPALTAAIVGWAEERFADDRAAAHWEPSGDDFLSPTLIEARLMSRVLGPERFLAWLATFLPSLPSNLRDPAFVSDRTDGKIAHLDGLNLSRAWCLRGLKAWLPGADEAATRHLNAALPHLADDYAGEHWLATFALLALSE